MPTTQKVAAVKAVAEKADAERPSLTTPKRFRGKKMLEGGAFGTPPKPCPRPLVAWTGKPLRRL